MELIFSEDEIPELQGLTRKQRAFVLALPTTGWNVSAACRIAYGSESAGYQGDRLVKNPKIQAAIKALRRKVAEMVLHSGVSVPWVTKRLMVLADSNIANYLSYDETGYVTLKPLDGIPEELQTAIKSVKNRSQTRKSSEGGTVTTEVREFTLQDKIRPLELLAEATGMVRHSQRARSTRERDFDLDRSGYFPIPFAKLTDAQLRAIISAKSNAEIEEIINAGRPPAGGKSEDR